MDMYNTKNGVAFGEATIHTGSYKSYNKHWDEKLGKLYMEAKEPSDKEISEFLEKHREIFGFK